ncbi:MAG TPA: hypothetical protein VM260_15440, partial [Pirellula sp.]|nr:hypothetical protein [Pirellula sp.]
MGKQNRLRWENTHFITMSTWAKTGLDMLDSDDRSPYEWGDTPVSPAAVASASSSKRRVTASPKVKKPEWKDVSLYNKSADGVPRIEYENPLLDPLVQFQMQHHMNAWQNANTFPKRVLAMLPSAPIPVASSTPTTVARPTSAASQVRTQLPDTMAACTLVDIQSQYRDQVLFDPDQYRHVMEDKERRFMAGEDVSDDEEDGDADMDRILARCEQADLDNTDIRSAFIERELSDAKLTLLNSTGRVMTKDEIQLYRTKMNELVTAALCIIRKRKVAKLAKSNKQKPPSVATATTVSPVSQPPRASPSPKATMSPPSVDV